MDGKLTRQIPWPRAFVRGSVMVGPILLSWLTVPAAAGYWSNVWMVKPWVFCYWGARPIEDMVLSLNYLSDANWNDYNIADQQLDKWIIEARGELNDDRRAELYHDIALKIRDEGGALVPAFSNMVHALGEKVGKSEHTGGSWEMDGGHCIKRWWLT